LVLIVFSLVAVISALGCWISGAMGLFKAVGLFLTIEGAALLVSAFSPVGWLPFEGGLIEFLGWLRGPKDGEGRPLAGGVQADLLMLYGGFLVSVAGAIVMNVAR
jgi:hypothetical protein